MTVTEARKLIVGEMAKNGKSPEEIARMEIAIQYLGDFGFRKKLNDFVFKQTYKQGNKED